MTHLLTLLALIGLSGCSFFEPAAKPFRVTLPRQLFTMKGRPSLSSMDHFALLARGPVSNSLSQSDIGRRSLSCTQLEGQVLFPLSLEDLAGGFTLSVPPGNYRFSVVGFSSSNVTNPSSVAQLVSGSPSLATYLIAQGQINTVGKTTGSLAVSYQDGVTADLFSACPPLSYALSFGTYGSGALRLYRNDSGSWAESTVGTTNYFSGGGMYMDSDNLGHFIYGSGAGLNLLYASSDGAITGEQLSMSGAGYPKDSAIGRANDGTLTAFANRDFGGGLGEAGFYTRSGTIWTFSDPLFNVLSNGYAHHKLSFGANNATAVAATNADSYDVITVRYRPPSSSWQAAFALNSIGSIPCTTRAHSPDIKLDADGFAHLVFVCEGAGLSVGYGTNRGGSWAYRQIDVSASTPITPSLDIDSAGTVHVAYGADGVVLYLNSILGSGAWSSSQSVYTSPEGGLYSLQLKAIGDSEVHIVANELFNSPGRRLVHISKVGLWSSSPIATHDNTFNLAQGLWAR